MYATIKWQDLWLDARANSWKRGRIQPREDGLHTEMQMVEGNGTNDSVDMAVAKRYAIEGVARLTEVLKEFEPSVSFSTNGGSSYSSSIPTSRSGITAGSRADMWRFTLTPNPRNNMTEAEASGLAHAFVLAHIMMGWSRLVDNGLEDDWKARQDAAGLNLLSGLRYQTSPI